MRSERGFTLLEVLVSVAIIAIALVALLALQNHSVGMVQSAEMITGARLLSQRLMGEGELTGVPGGEAEGEEGPYRWVLTQIKMTPALMPAGLPPLPGKRLSLDIYWTAAGREEKLSFAEYIYEG